MCCEWHISAVFFCYGHSLIFSRIYRKSRLIFVQKVRIGDNTQKIINVERYT